MITIKNLFKSKALSRWRVLPASCLARLIFILVPDNASRAHSILDGLGSGESEAVVVLWLAYRLWKRGKQRENRQYSVLPICQTLYPELRVHKKQLYNHFRMLVKSFDEMLKIIDEYFSNCEIYVVRDVVSAEEKTF